MIDVLILLCLLNNLRRKVEEIIVPRLESERGVISKNCKPVVIWIPRCHKYIDTVFLLTHFSF